MQPFWQQPRPPHVVFERRPVEKRKKDEEGGTPYYVDTDFIVVTPSGSKDRIERVWDEYQIFLKKMVKEGNFPQVWLTTYEEAHTAWSRGEDIPVNGTPVRNWPAISAGQLKALIKADIVTIEELAGANEAQISNLGMGGRGLVQLARDWLTARTGTGQIAEEMTALRSTNTTLEARLKAMEKQLAALGGAKQTRDDRAYNAFIKSTPQQVVLHDPEPPETVDETSDIDLAIADAGSELAGRASADDD